jgi:hypothetical protein
MTGWYPHLFLELMLLCLALPICHALTALAFGVFFACRDFEADGN